MMTDGPESFPDSLGRGEKELIRGKRGASKRPSGPMGRPRLVASCHLRFLSSSPLMEHVPSEQTGEEGEEKSQTNDCGVLCVCL